MSDEILNAIKDWRAHYDENTNSLAVQLDEVAKKAGNVDDTVINLKEQYSRERDEILHEMKELKDSYETRLSEMEASQKAPGATRSAPESIGQKFVGSEEFTQLKDRRFQAPNGVSAQVPSFLKANSLTQNSSDVASEYGAWGNLIPIHELGTFGTTQRDLRIRDLLPVVPTQSDTVRYIKMGYFRNVYTTVATGTSTTVFTVADASGLVQGQEIYVGANAAPKLIASISGVTVTLATTGTSPTTGVTYSALSGTPSTGDVVYSDYIPATAHGATKPRANWVGPTVVTETISTIAHWTAIHRQTLADVPQMRGIIDNDLIQGLRLNEEYQILRGTNQGDDLNGLLNSGQNTAAVTIGGSDNNIDYLRRVLNQAELSFNNVSSMVLHPTDWMNLEMMKDTDGRYLLFSDIVNGGAQGGQRRIWRVPVVSTVAMTLGKFLMGDFARAAYILDREDANVRIAEQHAEYFTSNMVAILAEERLGLAVPRPDALFFGTFE